jgi:hypothetical protein
MSQPGKEIMKTRTTSQVLIAGCFALMSTALAVTPPPDGAYPNENTAEGENALFSLTTGIGNTGIGSSALDSVTDGIQNTAVGWLALERNSGSQNTAVGVAALSFNTTGDENTAVGSQTLMDNSDGTSNTAIGFAALAYADGTNNTATGAFAMFGNVFLTGSYNTADGFQVLSNDTTGSFNSGTGAYALSTNTTGGSNTANGYHALSANTTGGNNTANGAFALFSSTIGFANTANGYQALYKNTAGFDNTANGHEALFNNTTGNNNTASGVNALYSNTTSGGNSAYGLNALYFNTTGGSNTAVGPNALYNNTIGSTNIALGASAGNSLTTGSNNIDIGNFGAAGEANTIRIGTTGTHTNTYVAGIYKVTAAKGVAVFVDSNGHLGTATSSARFKDQIKPMDKASEAILSLRPVTFRYKHELDPDSIPQFGLVAEQVEKVNPDLVAHDDQGKPYTVRYEAVNAMLLNEFLKEHRKVGALEAKMAQQQSTNADQQKAIQALNATLKEQTAQIQKVSGQLAAASPSRGGLEASKPTPQLVVDNQ